MLPIYERITRAYHDELSRATEELISAEQLPTTAHPVTPQWLSAILCEPHDGARVVDCEVEALDTPVQHRRRIHLEYNSVGQQLQLPTRLFCKTTQDLDSRIMLGRCDCARAEAIFYNEIRPHLNIEAPIKTFARFDTGSYNSTILLSDLTLQGARFLDYETLITFEVVKAQLKLLAEVHGKSCSDPHVKSQLGSLQTWPTFFESTAAVGFKEYAEAGIVSADGRIPLRLRQDFEHVWRIALASVERHRELPQMLIHADAHCKNWYTTAEGEIGLCDWQTASRGHWSRDVAHVMSHLRVEHRRAWEKELLEFYIDQLHAAGGPKETFAAAWTHYRQQMMSALIWWAVTANAQHASSVDLLHRAATAVDDLDSLRSF